MGSGIAAAGFSIVNWGTMGQIVAHPVMISPVLGGIIAAAFSSEEKNHTTRRYAGFGKKVCSLFDSLMSGLLQPI